MNSSFAQLLPLSLLLTFPLTAYSAMLTTVEPLVFLFDHGDINTTANSVQKLGFNFSENLPTSEGFHISFGDSPNNGQSP